MAMNKERFLFVLTLLIIAAAIAAPIQAAT